MTRILLAALLMTACTPPPVATVAVVGIDAGDWDILDHFIAQGRLPNLQRLRQQGATARLDIESPRSPESWTTLATGQPPEVHGIVQGDSSVGMGFFANTRQVKVRRLWDMVGEHDKRSLVVDWWITEPAYQIKGVLISREGAGAWPEDARQVEQREIMPAKDYEKQMRHLGFVSPRTGNMLAWMARERFDLLMLPVYCHDQALHQLWNEFDTQLSGVAAAELERLGAGTAARVARGYEMVAQTAIIGDTLLGRAMEYVGQEGYVMLVSDHGHSRAPGRVRRIALSRQLFDGGGGTIERGELEGDNQTGAVRYTLRDVQRQKQAHITSMDYTLRYPVVSLDGPGADLARAALLELTLGSGAPLLAETSTGDLAPSPALFDVARGALGSQQAGQYSIFVNTGAHGYDDQGVFGLLGPDVVPGELPEPVRSLDVTPTALWLMGLPVPEDIAGRAALQALSEAGQRRRPLRGVASYEDGTRPWTQSLAPTPQAPPRDPGTGPGDGAGLQDKDPAEIERLKALGYVQ